MSAPRLYALETLARDLARALRAHIEEEARRAGADPAVLCPCHSDELARADALLGRLDEDDDPDPVHDDDPDAGDPLDDLVGPDPEPEPWDA